MSRATTNASADHWPGWTDNVIFEPVPGAMQPVVVRSRNRPFAELDGKERQAVRRRWERGHKLASIAAGARCFAGSIVAAAEAEGWKRGGPPSKFATIRAIKRANPAMSGTQIARQANACESYVAVAIRTMKAGAPC